MKGPLFLRGRLFPAFRGSPDYRIEPDPEVMRIQFCAGAAPAQALQRIPDDDQSSPYVMIPGRGRPRHGSGCALHWEEAATGRVVIPNDQRMPMICQNRIGGLWGIPKDEKGSLLRGRNLRCLRDTRELSSGRTLLRQF